jgi:hypothetical protein
MSWHDPCDRRRSGAGSVRTSTRSSLGPLGGKVRALSDAAVGAWAGKLWWNVPTRGRGVYTHTCLKFQYADAS